ncbi:MAG TPA: SRPBCC family protein [Holophagaceae bacterium]|jgi:uncharacterized protein YndB with AHSA1/START domain|nr:SRPBCC family protein [Holophagaceae bacterium]
MTSNQTYATEREIISTRLLDAPRELVWKVWTDPQHLVHWWGPNGFTNSFETYDFRPGGEWRFVMHGADGTDYPNHSVFVEIVEPERIVLDHLSGPRFRMEAAFEDRGGKTALSFRATFATEKDYEAVKGFAIEGNRQTLSRLEDLVALAGGPAFTLSRTYDAPRDRVWQAWTEGGRLARWWGPKGLKMRAAKLDLLPGGLFHYGMSMPDGQEMWGKFTFRDIVAERRLLFVNAFSDAEGSTTRHPMAASWPLEILNLVTFEEVEGRTTLTLRGVPIHASEEERKTFEDGFASMQQGFKGALDQLDDYLAQTSKGKR